MPKKLNNQPNRIYSLYMYKEELGLNDLRGLICHKPNQAKRKSV